MLYEKNIRNCTVASFRSGFRYSHARGHILVPSSPFEDGLDLGPVLNEKGERWKLLPR